MSCADRFVRQLAVGCLGVQAVVGSCHAATNTAASAAYSDVAAAVAAAAEEDTVMIPAGTATWTNTLTITKGINLIGAGSNSTILTNLPLVYKAPWSSSWRPPFISVELPSNRRMRISGIRFFCNTNQGIVFQNSTRIDSVRVDHCLFERANSYALWFKGDFNGVCDHCTFVDGRQGVGRSGNHSASWSLYSPPLYGLGSTNTWVVEDCLFIWSGWSGAPSSQPMDCGQGSHYVFRYNTLNYSNAPTSVSHDGLGLNGNSHLQQVDGSRGSVFCEIYGNTWHWAADNGFRIAKLNGGTSMVFSNTITGRSGSQMCLLDEDETWASYVFDYPNNRALYVLTTGPAQDQVTNTFIWGNTFNGSTSAIGTLATANPSLNPLTQGTATNPVSIAVQEGRDYWSHSPWGADNCTNRAGGVNVMREYAPLTYPHPRVQAEDPPPLSAATNITASATNVTVNVTNTAASAAYSDVATAVAAAAEGDTVRIPAGAAVWTNTLIITKGINLIGAGTNATVLTNSPTAFASGYNSSWRPPLVSVEVTNNRPMRISGIRFFCNTNQGIIFQSSTRIDSVRVDHCLFERANSYAIWFRGEFNGVCDHCTFVDGRLGLGRNGNHFASWNLYTPPLYGLGTTNTWVVEDCLFAWSGWPDAPSSQPMDCGQGSHYVFRYNTMNYTNAPTSVSHDGLDLHGNNHLNSVDGWRGSVFCEIYGNTWYWAAGNGFRIAKLRGGTSMVFSNTITGRSGSETCQLDEEETWANYVFDYPNNRTLSVLTTAAAQDQVTNTFIWGNTFNGSAVTISALYSANPNLNPVTQGTSANPVSLAIQEERDYWNHSPWEANNYTNRAGGVNVMRSYTPLIYPHPRVQAEDLQRPGPPSNVRIAKKSK